MPDIAAKLAGDAIFGRRTFGSGDRVRAWRRVGICVGAVTAAGVVVGGVAVAAAWFATVALGTAPHNAKTPLDLEMRLLANLHGGLVAPDGSALDLAASDAAPSDAASNDADNVTLLPLPEVKAGKGPRLDAEQIAMTQSSGSDDESFPLGQRGDRLPIHVASAPADQASLQAAAATPSSAVFASLDLFDPDPTVVGSLPYALTATSQLAPNRFVEEMGNASPPPSHSDGPRVAAVSHDIAAVPAKPAAKPNLPEVAALTPPASEPPASDTFSWFRKLFGRRPAPKVAAAELNTDGHTAVYDIEAHIVYMPDGKALEAHSGLGARLDDPRYVSEKARGPTPPNVYELALRSGLFHGVRALRLNPVSDSKMFGRDGILAHPYMLGPNGQSNGCVSFKDYPEFLKAFERGDVDRLVVVPHLPAKPADDQARNGEDGRPRVNEL